MTTPQPPTCLTCHYALTGVREPRCPECGRDFNPADPATYGPRASFITVIAAWAPPRWFNFALVTLLLLAALVASSPNGLLCDNATLVPMFAVHILLPMWTLAFAVYFIARRIMQYRQAPLPRRRWSWFAMPVIVFAYLTLWRTGAVFWLRWYHAKPDVLAVQQQIKATGMNTAQSNFKVPTWVGTFRVTGFTYQPDGTIQLLLGASERYTDSPARLEYGPSAPTGSPVVAELTDGWWLCWDHT